MAVDAICGRKFCTRMRILIHHLKIYNYYPNKQCSVCKGTGHSNIQTFVNFATSRAPTTQLCHTKYILVLACLHNHLFSQVIYLPCSKWTIRLTICDSVFFTENLPQIWPFFAILRDPMTNLCNIKKISAIFVYKHI